jgi:cysteine desulfurase
MIYLDNAATTPVNPAALQAAWPWLTSEFGNPSSTHELGARAKDALEDARARIAEWLGCRVSEITFTSGGTEGNNMAITGLAIAQPRGKHIISARTEHEAVLETLDFLERLHGFEVSWLPVDLVGSVDPADLRAALRSDTTLVTLMTANNEIGTVHSIAELAAIAHEFGAAFHTDAVQAAGWLDIRVDTSHVDALTISGHKIGAPKGSGAVFIRGRLAVEPLMHGGGQEGGRRSGTENIAWAVALATAIDALPDLASESARVSGLRDGFIRAVLQEASMAIPTGHPVERLPSIASFCFEGLSGEAILLELERREVIVSSGSACAAGSDEPSHVLTAIGFDADTARTAVRFSFNHNTTEQDLSYAANALTEAIVAVGGTGKIA